MSDGETSQVNVEEAAAAADPRRLIAEAFAMPGITEPDCRSIFFDWALGLDESVDQRAAIETLLAAYESAPADHPMRAVLLEGLGRRPGVDSAETPTKGRRGGRRARVEG